ncbi:MAG: hypothetical protein IJR97_04905 [Clostridia bacterium]|nr:hypothetical protein [Clostridia bacterium]
MHFPVMILSEKPMTWEDIYDRIGPYTEAEDNPLYQEDHDHKFDYWGQGGRYAWMLGGDFHRALRDFPMIHPEDTEEELRAKCPALWEAWKKDPKGMTCEECFRSRFCFSLVLPDGTWLEPGKSAWWLGALAAYEKDIDWEVEFGKILDSCPRDWYINIVDCHI